MNQDILKEIISPFINLSPGSINESTIIDRSAAKSSIVIHRMYAALGKANFQVENYQNIRTFGELKQKLTPGSSQKTSVIIPETPKEELFKLGLSIGIDLEKVSNLPHAIDYRTDEFYTQNFTQSEISYCLLQKNPPKSFAGLFAVKEAIFKSDNEKKGLFNTIEIKHDKKGAPIFEGFAISISQTEDIVTAVSIRLPEIFEPNQVIIEKDNDAKIVIQKNHISLFYKLIIVLGFILSIISLVLHIELFKF